MFIGLLRKFIVRRVLEERLRSAVTVLGIALGVAVVIGIQLTNESSVRGFEAALETVAGKTSLEIVAPGPGLDEMRLRDMLWLRDYGEVSPVVEGDAVARLSGAREAIRILGVDILRDRSFREYNLLETAERGTQPNAQEFLQLLIDPRSIVLADTRNGAPLPGDVGPFQLVVPDENRGARWVRQVERIVVFSAAR